MERLTTNDMMDVVLTENHPSKQFFNELKELAGKLSDQIFAQIQTRSMLSKTRGLKGTFDDVTVMSYAIAGRLMVCLWLGDSFVSFVGAEEHESDVGERRRKNNMNLQGCDASHDELRKMIATVSKLWNVNVLQEDSKVGLI